MSSSDEADAPVSAAEEAFVQRQNAAVKRLNALGTALIRGIDEDAASPGEEEVAACRILVITKERAAAIEAAQKFAMGRDGSDSDSDDDGGFVMFDTSTGNAVVAGIADAVARAVARTSKPARFDHLLALTYALQQEDTWARDNEMWEDGDEMQSACAKLAAAWKKLLGESTNEQLGCDEEFTRPGTEALLEDFGKMLESVGGDTDVSYPFDWKP
jgi:hypothetical protein|mmetsp:Transcript_99553/g.242122  ORF Transcript_99553/g.242122 Transcript_99553/m.242122 type:complete len:215 (-) Transcript_99553:110-754(-)